MGGLASRLIPDGSRRRRGTRRIQSALRPDRPGPFDAISYAQWIKKVEPGSFARPDVELSHRPVISVVVPCHNTPTTYMTQLVDSVVKQRYKEWQLCLVDGSDDEQLRRHIEAQARRDPRIDYLPMRENRGIAGNTNAGIRRATGEYIAFVDHDDLLSEHALFEVVRVLNDFPGTDLVYSDEDKVSGDGLVRREPFFKPDWSPELLLGVNYITHLVVARRKLIDEIGGLRNGLDGAQDHDLLLRLTERTANIRHVPHVLYHWRSAPGSTALDIGEKAFADAAGREALQDAMDRREVAADIVAIQDRPANYRVRFRVAQQDFCVSVIVAVSDSSDLVARCVGSVLRKSSFENVEVIVVSSGHQVGSLPSDPRCQVVSGEAPATVARLRNLGRRQAGGRYLIFLDSSVEVVTADWVEELVSVAGQDGVGVVGPLMRYDDGRMSHAGTVLGLTSIAGHVFRLRRPTDWTHFGLPAWPRNYLATSGGCLAVSAERFDQIGGFDETLTAEGSEIAVGIRLHEAGYRNVYWPFAELLTTRSSDQIQNDDRLVDYCRPYLDSRDPYFNANLDWNNEQVGLGPL